MKRFTAVILSLLLIIGVFAYAESEQPATEESTTEFLEFIEEPAETATPETSGEPAETATPEPTEEPGRLDGLIIGIDPGHQAHQNTEKELVSPKGKEKKAKVSSGTSGRTTKIPEYQTVLEVSLLLRDALEAEGATVVMTRDTNDINISNLERAQLMNEADADLVLRIHCNGNEKKSAHGTALYVRKSIAYGKDKVPDPKALLNAEYEAAQCIIKAMCAETGAKNLGVIKRDSYTMNNWSTVPIILVEMGFMTNPEEDVKLNDPEYQAKLANGMVAGIADYFDR